MRPGQACDSLNEEREPRYTIESVSTEEGLSALESDWNRLSETADHPNAFVTYGWFRAWVRRIALEYHSGRFLPNVLVLRESGSVAGIAPLVRHIASRFFRVRKLEFASIHADYNDLVLGKDPTGQTMAIADFLARTSAEWDVVDLRDLRDTGEQIALIERALEHVGLSYRFFPEQNSCPYLTIGGDASEVTKRLSGHVRRTLRNRSVRAAAQGLRTRIIENPAREPDLLRKLIVLESKKHLRSVHPPFIGTYPDVFQSLFDNLGPHGWLYVALLELGDQPVAFQFGFRCGDKLWDYAKAYDRSFSRFAPGTLLLLALLDYGFGRGFREYDFLRGEEPYKMIWGTGCQRRLRVLIWNRRKISRVRKFIYYDLRSAVNWLLRKRI
jgi:CelD/BcsL family acetyltransferase involved in cellulose biosynthesis